MVEGVALNSWQTRPPTCVQMAWDVLSVHFWEELHVDRGCLWVQSTVHCTSRLIRDKSLGPDYLPNLSVRTHGG